MSVSEEDFSFDDDEDSLAEVNDLAAASSSTRALPAPPSPITILSGAYYSRTFVQYSD